MNVAMYGDSVKYPSFFIVSLILSIETYYLNRIGFVGTSTHLPAEGNNLCRGSDCVSYNCTNGSSPQSPYTIFIVDPFEGFQRVVVIVLISDCYADVRMRHQLSFD